MDTIMTARRPAPRSAGGASFGVWLVPALVIAAWLPAMVASMQVWRHGMYYDYGWFVPPAAIGLMLRRWWQLQRQDVRQPARYWLVLWCGLLPWFLVLRVLGHVDPSWRMPMWLLGGAAAVFGHVLIASVIGWRGSARFLCITLLWLSALPWPSVLERGIIEWLTDRVVTATAEWFQWFGRPVEVLGDRLRLHDVTVEVTDGCSGVRSFQSFLMATWFFAEWQRLKPDRAVMLLLFACVTGFLVNTVRTYLLAIIRFDHGVEAFETAHDSLGLAAFVASAVIFYFLSDQLATERRVLVRRAGPDDAARSRLAKDD